MQQVIVVAGVSSGEDAAVDEETEYRSGEDDRDLKGHDPRPRQPLPNAAAIALTAPVLNDAGRRWRPSVSETLRRWDYKNKINLFTRPGTRMCAAA